MTEKTLNRVGSGVYRITTEDGEVHQISGKLHYILSRAKAFKMPTIMYLAPDGTDLGWRPVNIEKHEHYFGEQQKQLLSWFYATDCPMSLMGRKRFSNITGITASRINHAVRRPDTPDYKPFSDQAMLYIKWKVTDFLKSK